MTQAFRIDTVLYGQIGDLVRILPAAGTVSYSPHYDFAGQRGRIIGKLGTNGPLDVRLLEETTNAETDSTLCVLDEEVDNETLQERKEAMTREQRLMVASVVFAPATVALGDAFDGIEVDKSLWDAFVGMAQHPPFNDPSEVLNDFLRDYTEAYRATQTQGSAQE